MQTSDQEQPAKNWQVAALETRLETQEKLSQRIDEKLDKIVQAMVTTSQYDNRLELIEKNFDSKLQSAIREVNLEYRPMAKNISWVTRTVIVAIVGIIAQLVIFFISVRG